MITQTPKHVNDGFEKRDGFQKPCSPTLKNQLPQSLKEIPLRSNLIWIKLCVKEALWIRILNHSNIMCEI